MTPAEREKIRERLDIKNDAKWEAPEPVVAHVMNTLYKSPTHPLVPTTALILAREIVAALRLRGYDI